MRIDISHGLSLYCCGVLNPLMLYYLIFHKDLNVDDVEAGSYAEASLSGVEPLMQKIHSEIRKVDAEILTAVRQQVGISIYWF